MQREDLLGDLKALHHGRGIRRARVQSWLGGTLKEVLGATPGLSDAELRSALARLLARHTRALPQDLRYLFRVAAGLEADHPILEQRLTVASVRLDRSIRVLRRRLRTAEELVADSLAAERVSEPQWFDARGWQWLASAYDLVLRTDAMLTMRRSVHALSSHNKFIHEMFTIPGVGPDEEVTFTARAGLSIIGVERVSATGWRVGLELPRELAPGEEHETVLQLRVPNARGLSPFFVVAPVREIPLVHVAVDFGDESQATQWWPLDGVLPSDLWHQYTAPRSVDALPARGVARRDFTAPRVGLAFGIAWTWAQSD